MILAITILLLVVLWLAIEAYGLGWWNTVDCLAYKLHRYAMNGRAMHARKTSEVAERWIRALESDGQPWK